MEPDALQGASGGQRAAQLRCRGRRRAALDEVVAFKPGRPLRRVPAGHARDGVEQARRYWQAGPRRTAREDYETGEPRPEVQHHAALFERRRRRLAPSASARALGGRGPPLLAAPDNPSARPSPPRGRR